VTSLPLAKEVTVIGTLNSAAIERIDRPTNIHSPWTSSGEDTKLSILLILSVSAMPDLFRTVSARVSLAAQSFVLSHLGSAKSVPGTRLKPREMSIHRVNFSCDDVQIAPSSDRVVYNLGKSFSNEQIASN
jgi:hypothetical protein